MNLLRKYEKSSDVYLDRGITLESAFNFTKYKAHKNISLRSNLRKFD